MPRRTRKRMVSRWEQIEREAREDELKELERGLHGEQERSQKPKPERKRRRQQVEPPAPDANSSSNNGTDDTGSNG